MNFRNVTTILALSLAATACGKKDNAQAKQPEKPAETKPAEAKPAETKPAEPPAAAMTECPKDDALKAKVAEMQKVEKAAVLDASCTAGKFPEPGFFIYSRTQHDGAEGATVDAFTLVAASGK